MRLPLTLTISGASFLILATVAAVLVADRSPEFAFRGWVGIVGAVFAVLAVASACTARGVVDPRARAIVLVVVVAVSLLNLLFALRQALFGLSAEEIASAQTGVSTYLVGDQIRLMGLFATNQDFGAFGATVAPALLILGISVVARRRWFLVLSLLAYAAVLLSLTRTALIAAIATGLLGVLLWGRGKIVGRTVRITFAVLALGALVFGIASSIDNARVQDALTRALTLLNLGGDTSYIARSNQTLPIALDAFFSNLWGSGAGAAGPVSQAFPALAPFGALTTDNGYLLIGVQMGVFGLLAFVVMLVAAAIWLGRATSGYARAGAASIIAIMVAMFFAQYWGLLAPMSFAAAFVGIGIASRADSKPVPHH